MDWKGIVGVTPNAVVSWYPWGISFINPCDTKILKCSGPLVRPLYPQVLYS